MNRTLASILAITLVALVIVSGASSDRGAIGDEFHNPLVHAISTPLLVLGMLIYCGFAAIHSTQHIESPHKRTRWLVVTIGLNVFGSLAYYLTEYQAFRKTGKGGLISSPPDA